MRDLIVIGNPHIGHDIAVYLAQHNIPFIDIEHMDKTTPTDNVLIITSETKLSEIIRVIDLESNNRPFIITPMPRLDDILTYSVTTEDNKPFYDGVYQKGGKKRKKRFGR